MQQEIISIAGINIPVHSLNTVVVGSGAAAFNAADNLYNLGQTDIAMVTEGVTMGTSRNTGSDKQTYYKLTMAGGGADSVREMAQTLFDGGSMHGDIALVEAALSARCFNKLADIGVPFPHNRFGEYIGYKTDHDPRQRATSAGPLTSKFMTEKLERQVNQKNIKIFDGFLVIGIITQSQQSGDSEAAGLLAINVNDIKAPHYGLTLFNTVNIVYATGGPAGMYRMSVYPVSHTGSSGMAFEAGARGINLTESQYGIASIKFRWNLSGTYQQVLPRYVSTDAQGNDEREFLDEFFENPGTMLDDIFLKGYQWPFDPRKIANYGSSIVDILVYYETVVRNRRVYLDFRKNPARSIKNGAFDFALLNAESYQYLEKSGALFGTPIERLAKMNQPAIDLYKNNGIDLNCELLEIAVCAQHNNGGLMGNMWWESNVRHLFPVGEVSGTFGVYRPGGSALNSTQVGSLRAAQYIHANYTQPTRSTSDFALVAEKLVQEKVALITALVAKKSSTSNVMAMRSALQERMTRDGAHIRNNTTCRDSIAACAVEIKQLASMVCIASLQEIPDVFRNRDMLITQFVYLNAISDYINRGGRSRGSYLINDPHGQKALAQLPDDFRFSLEEGGMKNQTSEIAFDLSTGTPQCSIDWKPVRPIPEGDYWFENVWNQYRKNEIIK